MDLGELAKRACDFVIYAGTSSALAFSFWVAVAWLLLLMTRRPLIWVLCRWLGIDDRSVEKAIVSRIDGPLQLLLLLLAALPFVQMMPGVGGHVLLRLERCLIPFLACHV